MPSTICSMTENLFEACDELGIKWAMEPFPLLNVLAPSLIDLLRRSLV
jgi:hypothetical protein